jgi:hypothetical protein
MTSSIEYAQMPSNAYAVKDLVTHEKNIIPIPEGWEKLGDDRINDLTGFSARAYQNTATGEIVIAYTGMNSSVASTPPRDALQQGGKPITFDRLCG